MSVFKKIAVLLFVATSIHGQCCPGSGFHFTVSAPAPDVYRIDVNPSATDSGTGELQMVRSERTALRLYPGDGKLEIVRFDVQDDPIAWSCTVRPLGSFGRAGVRGLEFSWPVKPREAIYGAGERFDALNQAGKKIDFWIKDAPGQDGAATYHCTPVFYSSAGYGLFFTNNPEALADFNSDGAGRHRYQRAGTSATFYVAIRPTIKEQIQARASVQGPYRGVPDWSWGPWISRNSYENQGEAEEAIKGMIARDMPVSVIVQEAWKGPSESGEFNSFSTSRWPRLTEFFALCSEHGIKNVLWQVPIVHPSYPGFNEAAKKKYFVCKPDGTVSFRKEWLSDFANIDFTNPEAREYWKDQMRGVVKLGAVGFKADDGEDIKPDDVFFDGRRGWQMHNEYSTLYNRTLTELLDEEKADGMLWSRSGSLGNETCPALWAGDQGARFDQLRSLIPAGLSASMSGMPFWGHDIGGYFGDCYPELYIRWLQFGAFSPFMQYHGNKPREPWYFGPEAEAAYKLLSHLRMSVKPMLIDLGREAAEKGIPIMRPMALEFPDDPRFASEDSQYMLGPDILVAPVYEEGMTGRRVQFPPGRWQDILSPIVYDGGTERSVVCPLVGAPAFVREGATLKVQLAEGASLGTWSADAPVRELHFGPDRVSITNPPLPPSLSVFYDGSRVAGPGKHTIKAQVRNLSDIPMTVHITAQADEGVVLATNEMDLIVPPNATVKPSWKATFAEDHRVGETRVTFSIASNQQATASYIRQPRWIVVGAFPAEARQAHGMTFTPEWEQEPDVAFEAGYRVVQWQAVPLEHLVKNDGIDFKVLLGERDHAAAYALTWLESDKDQDAELRFGSDDTLKVWLNDREVHNVEVYRLAAYDQEVIKVQLKAGRNKVLAKVCQDLNPWKMMFRLTGPGGAPIAGVHDGFQNIDAYRPDRPMAGRVVTPSPPIVWRVAGPFTLSWPFNANAKLNWKRGQDTVDLGGVLGAARNACAYAMTEIVVDMPTPVEFRCGSDDGLRVALNGNLIIQSDPPRAFKPGEDIARVTLRPGTNTIVCRIAQTSGEWKFRCEVWDLSVDPPRPIGIKP